MRRKLVTAAKEEEEEPSFSREEKKTRNEAPFFAGERRIGNGTHGMLKDAKEKEQEKNCMEGWEIDSNKI